MKREKIVESFFDADTGVSCVKLQTPRGVFAGYSMLQKEDEPFISAYAGCRYAELKAMIKARQAEIKEAKIELHAFERFHKQLECSKKFKRESYEASKIRRHIYELRDKIKILEGNKEYMNDILTNSINNRQRKINDFYDRKAESD